MSTRVRNLRRVRARRDKNYKAVHRPTRWGNPFSIEKYGREQAIRLYKTWLSKKLKNDPDFIEPLRGYNLGCFCSPDVSCHADVILERFYSSPG